MIRRISILLVILMLGAVASAQAFPDVPEGHWAEEAVTRLADLGIVMGFPDGSFRGEEGFTRYQAALVVDRLLRVVEDDREAGRVAFQDELETLRGAVTALADELAEVRRLATTNRDALEALWREVATLREELELPPPAPLPEPAETVVPVVPTPVEPAPAAPGAAEPAPGEPEAEAAPDADREGVVDALEPVEPVLEPPAAADPAEEEVPPPVVEVGEDAEVPRDVAPELMPGEPIVDAPAVRRPGPWAGVAFGSALPPRFLARAVVGVEDLPLERFGARLALDLGRPGGGPVGTVALVGHVTYRWLEVDRFAAHAGLGGGYAFAGDGAFGSVLIGATWAATDPVDLFAEVLLDGYLQPAPADAGARFTPSLALGVRWNF